MKYKMRHISLLRTNLEKKGKKLWVLLKLGKILFQTYAMITSNNQLVSLAIPILPEAGYERRQDHVLEAKFIPFD